MRPPLGAMGIPELAWLLCTRDAFLQTHCKAPQSGGYGVRAEFPSAVAQLGIAGVICSSRLCICNTAAPELLRAASTSPCRCRASQTKWEAGGEEQSTKPTRLALSLPEDANQSCRHQEEIRAATAAALRTPGGAQGAVGGDVQPHNPFALPSALLHYPPVFLNGEAGTALPPTPHCYLLPTFCYLFPRNRPLAEPNEETNIIRSAGTPSAPILLSFRPAAALGREVRYSESTLYKVQQSDPQGQSHPTTSELISPTCLIAVFYLRSAWFLKASHGKSPPAMAQLRWGPCLSCSSKEGDRAIPVVTTLFTRGPPLHHSDLQIYSTCAPLLPP